MVPLRNISLSKYNFVCGDNPKGATAKYIIWFATWTVVGDIDGGRPIGPFCDKTVSSWIGSPWGLTAWKWDHPAQNCAAHLSWFRENTRNGLPGWLKPWDVRFVWFGSKFDPWFVWFGSKLCRDEIYNCEMLISNAGHSHRVPRPNIKNPKQEEIKTTTNGTKNNWIKNYIEIKYICFGNIN